MPCSYAIAPTSESIGASGGAGSPIAVTTSANCTWTVSSNASWITITSAASGIGNGSVTFSVAANSGAARSGTLTVGGQTFTVDQAAACSYAIAPTNETFSETGGTGLITVTAPAGCSWTAVSNDAWVTIVSGASGSGNGAVGFLVATNPSNKDRHGTLTVAGELFTVRQRKH